MEDHVFMKRSDGRIEYEAYYRDELLHREGKPAFIYYYCEGGVKHEQYRKYGKLHNIKGPAWIVYNEDGSIKKEFYYLNDIYYEDMFKWMVAAGSLEGE